MAGINHMRLSTPKPLPTDDSIARNLTYSCPSTGWAFDANEIDRFLLAEIVKVHHETLRILTIGTSRKLSVNPQLGSPRPPKNDSRAKVSTPFLKLDRRGMGVLAKCSWNAQNVSPRLFGVPDGCRTVGQLWFVNGFAPM